MRDQTLLTTLEKYSLNRENLTRNLLLTIFCLFHPPKPKGYRWTICFETGGTSPPQGGSVIPWAPVLQINAAIHLTVNGIFDFSSPYESKLSTGPKKQNHFLLEVAAFA